MRFVILNTNQTLNFDGFIIWFVAASLFVFCFRRPEWAASKSILSDTNFLRKVKDFNKNAITENTLSKLKIYIENPKVTTELVERASKVK